MLLRRGYRHQREHCLNMHLCGRNAGGADVVLPQRGLFSFGGARPWWPANAGAPFRQDRIENLKRALSLIGQLRLLR
jgi:hypothetical protein